MAAELAEMSQSLVTASTISVYRGSRHGAQATANIEAILAEARNLAVEVDGLVKKVEELCKEVQAGGQVNEAVFAALVGRVRGAYASMHPGNSVAGNWDQTQPHSHGIRRIADRAASLAEDQAETGNIHDDVLTSQIHDRARIRASFWNHQN